MNRQKGYIDIPGWFFWLAPIGLILIIIELLRFSIWIYEHVEVNLK